MPNALSRLVGSSSILPSVMAAGETTAQLKVPKSPFIYGMSLLAGLAGLVHIALVFQPPPDLAEGEGAAL